MNIIEFFEANAGKWLSQRTSHDLAWPRSESGKAEVQFEILAASQLEVIQLCQQGNLATSRALCGARITWKGMMAADTQQQTGTTLLVAIQADDDLNQGHLLQQNLLQQNGRKRVLRGRYCLGRDDVLTLTTTSDTLYLEERLWFAGPNLRLRTSLLKHPNGFSSAAFCSEIRIGGNQPPAQTAVATSSAS